MFLGISLSLVGQIQSGILTWILASGAWEDSGVWIDAQTWNDGA